MVSSQQKNCAFSSSNSICVNNSIYLSNRLLFAVYITSYNELVKCMFTQQHRVLCKSELVGEIMFTEGLWTLGIRTKPTRSRSNLMKQMIIKPLKAWLNPGLSIIVCELISCSRQSCWASSKQDSEALTDCSVYEYAWTHCAASYSNIPTLRRVCSPLQYVFTFLATLPRSLAICLTPHWTQ